MTAEEKRVLLPLFSVLTVYFSAWVLLPPWLIDSYPFDVVEGIYWGREWQWGYYKHPPLSSWLLGALFPLFGRWTPFVLGQLCVAATLWLVFLLGRQWMSAARAASAAALTLAVFYFSWPSLEFNHNLAQQPFWALVGYALWMAYARGEYRDWLLFGVAAGAALLVKYPAAVLLLAALLFSLGRPQRHMWRTPRPWLSAAVAAAVFAPHGYWLITHDWLPLTYAVVRAEESAARSVGLPFSVLGFVAAQLGNHLPLVLVTAAARPWRWRGTGVLTAEQRRFLLWLLLMPTGLLLLSALLFGVGLKAMWGMPMWNWSGLFVVALVPEAQWRQAGRCLRGGLYLWLVLATVLMALYLWRGGVWRDKPLRTDWPQAALTEATQAAWARYSRCPLDSVGGHYWLAGLAAADAAGRPSVMVSDDAAFSPWMTDARLREHGIALLWPQDPALAKNRRFEMALMQSLPAAGLAVFEQELRLAWPKFPMREPLTVLWRGYVPPQCLHTPVGEE